MLFLTRTEGSETFIGDDIIIKIVEIKGKKIMIGIEAPKHIKIIRDDAVSRTEKRNFGEQNEIV